MYKRIFSTQDAKRFRDITDLVLEDANSLKRELGRSDRQKFAEYYDSTRMIEKQMARLEAMRTELSSNDGVELERFADSTGVVSALTKN